MILVTEVEGAARAILDTSSPNIVTYRYTLLLGTYVPSSVIISNSRTIEFGIMLYAILCVGSAKQHLYKCECRGCTEIIMMNGIAQHNVILHYS